MTTVHDDVAINKAATIRKCLKCIDDEYAGQTSRLRDNITVQDAIVLNLQRACEAAIDLAMHLVRTKRLGTPQTSRDAFARLAKDGELDAQLATELAKMVGFRNIAIHDYQSLDLDIVTSILDTKLVYLSNFASWAEQQ